jgi:hypothetical protein
MSQSIRVHSFTELAELLGVEDLESPAADEPESAEIRASGGHDTTPMTDQSVILAGLLARLEAATTTLSSLAQQDQQARETARRDLERYDILTRGAQEAKEARERASRVRREADTLAAKAFTNEAREAAVCVLELAAQAEAVAEQVADERRTAAEIIEQRSDVQKLLVERQKAEDVEKARAAESARAERIAGNLARARDLIGSGALEEAKLLLDSIRHDDPKTAEVAALEECIARRELASRVAAAEQALWLVRRDLRHDPVGAVGRLTTLDIDGLPEPLTKQVFGEWARACSRVCREKGLADPLRYAPNPGRGVVLAHDDAGRYFVVSSLGMNGHWKAGSLIDEWVVRGSRPLR